MNYEDLPETITVSGKTLTMYAGILSKMEDVIGGFMNLDNLTTDKSLQIEFVKTIVSKYDENGNVIGSELNVFSLKPSDFDSILQWGLEHYTVFTAESSAKCLEKLKMMEKKVTDLKESL